MSDFDILLNNGKTIKDRCMSLFKKIKKGLYLPYLRFRSSTLSYFFFEMMSWYPYSPNSLYRMKSSEPAVKVNFSW